MHWTWIECNAESMCLSNLGHVLSYAFPRFVWGVNKVIGAAIMKISVVLCFFNIVFC